MSHGKNNFTHFFPDVDMPDLVDGVDMRLIQFQPNLRTLPCSDRWKDWRDDELDMIPLYIRKGWKFQQLELILLQLPRLILDGIDTLAKAHHYEALSDATADLVEQSVRRTTLAATLSKIGPLLRPLRKTLANMQLTKTNPELKIAWRAVQEIAKYELIARKFKSRIQPFAMSPRVRDCPMVTKDSPQYQYRAVRRELTWWIRNTEANEELFQRERYQLKQQVSVYATTIQNLQTQLDQCKQQRKLDSANTNSRIQFLEKSNEQISEENANLKAKILDLENQLLVYKNEQTLRKSVPLGEE